MPSWGEILGEVQKSASERGGLPDSKAALIRAFVRQHVRPLPPLQADPLCRMVGVDSYEPKPVDEIVHG